MEVFDELMGVSVKDLPSTSVVNQSLDVFQFEQFLNKELIKDHIEVIR